MEDWRVCVHNSGDQPGLYDGREPRNPPHGAMRHQLAVEGIHGSHIQKRDLFDPSCPDQGYKHLLDTALHSSQLAISCSRITQTKLQQVESHPNHINQKGG